MDLQRLSAQFQTAADAINNCRKYSQLEGESQFDIEACVKDFAAKVNRLEELKREWTKLDAGDEFLKSITEEKDLIIHGVPGFSHLDAHAQTRALNSPKKPSG